MGGGDRGEIGITFEIVAGAIVVTLMTVVTTVGRRRRPKSVWRLGRWIKRQSERGYGTCNRG